MTSYTDCCWRAEYAFSAESVLIEEKPVLVCPADFPATWKKLGKKISKLEADRRQEGIPDTMPPWEQVTLNEAIVKLVRAFDISEDSVKQTVLEMYNKADEPKDSPFESLIKKAKQLFVKEAPKVGISKYTLQSLNELLQILTTKVCVTLDGKAVLYRKLGTMPHSCTPNCMFIPQEDDTAQLIAIRDIAAGESINCSHIPTNCLRANVETRQAWLRGIAGSNCLSSCCTTGHDLRRRVICPRCHPLDSRENLADGAICYTARSNITGKWAGLKCGAAMEESEAVDLSKEASLVKKILILNETDVDISRLSLYTTAALKDALKSFGKGHFCYQQLLLLQCGLTLHRLCETPTGDLFASWVSTLTEIVSFSDETGLPFGGMDELVRILLAPETLQMTVKLLPTIKKEEAEIFESITTFSTYVGRSCACLVLIEGSSSVHSQDGVKLKNWWLKKHRSFLSNLDKTEESFVSTSAGETPKATTVPESSAMVSIARASKLRQYAVPVAIGSAVIVSALALVTMYKRSNLRK
jgi:hypothetical protein